MRFYNHELSLSSDIFPEDQTSRKLISPPNFHEKCDDAQDDEKACAECKKSVYTSAISSPRSSRKVRRSRIRNKTKVPARAIGDDVVGTAKNSSQRLDALTYFEAQSSTAIESDPDQALWFTTESVKKAAVALWKEMQTSSRFRIYLENKNKPRKRKRSEAKWPRDLEIEFTFCHALVRWPPIGKKKIFYKGKKRGKNELLVEYLKEQTNNSLDRKIISSHIQNIRPWFFDNPKVLRYMPYEKKNKAKPNNQQNKRSQLRKARDCSVGVKRDWSLESDFVQAETHLRIPDLIPYYFEMFITDPRQSMPACLHVFTKSNHLSQLPDVQLQDVKHEETLIPPISRFIQSSLPLCQIIICEAYLDVFREMLPNGADLGIQFELTSESDLHNYVFQCITSIFDGRECVDSSAGRIGYDAEGSKRLHKIPFGSKYWARKMGGFTKSIRETEKKKSDLAAEDSNALEQLENDTEKRIAGLIDSLSATQEIYAFSKTDGHTERVLLVHWTFNYVRRNFDAVTTWRNLDVSQLQSRKASHEEYDFRSNGPENTKPSPYSLLTLSENDVAGSMLTQFSTCNESPSHLSLFGFLPESTTADAAVDIAEDAPNVAKQADYIDIATAAVITPEVSETQHVKPLTYFSNHGSLENTDRKSNEYNIVNDACSIDAEQSTLNIQVGFSDIYELSQSALSQTQDIVQPILSQSLSRSLSDDLSQSVSQQNPYFQSPAYQTVSNHDYSYHDLSQHVPRAVNMETEAVESDLTCSNWQSNELTFVSNPLRIQAHDHPHSQLQSVDWQNPSAVNVLNTTMYGYKDQQNQLCSFG